MPGPDPSDPTGGVPSQQELSSSGVAADSVLPSLMQVYNTMVQSKTPEGGLRGATARTGAAAGAPADEYTTAGRTNAAGQTTNYHHDVVGGPSNAAEWNAYAAAMAGHHQNNMSLPSIPPPFPTSTGGANPPPASATSATVEAVASGAETRSLRKRSNASSPTEDTSRGGSVSSSGRGGSSKARRKAKDTDPRWSKRFTWPDDLHRDFVAAIFDVGLKHSSPSTILEHMPKHEQITSERVKSHLQKYRIHRIKSKKEFMSSYDEGLKKIREGTLGTLSAGELASFLTHNSMNENEATDSADASPQQTLPRPATVENEDQNPNGGNRDTANPPQDILTLPRLTEAEKQSPIGASMGYLLGLFFSLKQQLMAQRAAAGAQSTLSTTQPMNTESSSAALAATAMGIEASSSFGVPLPIAPSHAVPATGAAGVPLPTSSNNVPPPAATTVVSNPSTRSNLEENNMMKREMQSQMAFQNKMRGLKEQELNKFRNAEAEKERASHAMATTTAAAATAAAAGHGSGLHTMTTFPAAASADAAHHQGAGEGAADGHGRGIATRGLSFGGAEDFWNTDVMDEQLFEFLMSE
eukprot:scaffold3410_cov158-Amphora_coffeaeformis.AAC.17